jgi:hypothetical protein
VHVFFSRQEKFMPRSREPFVVSKRKDASTFFLTLNSASGLPPKVCRGKTDEYIIMNDDEKETPGRRPFMNRLRCQIVRIEPDTQKGEIIIDVRVTSVSKT